MEGQVGHSVADPFNTLAVHHPSAPEKGVVVGVAMGYLDLPQGPQQLDIGSVS